MTTEQMLTVIAIVFVTPVVSLYGGTLLSIIHEKWKLDNNLKPVLTQSSFFHPFIGARDCGATVLRSFGVWTWPWEGRFSPNTLIERLEDEGYEVEERYRSRYFHAMTPDDPKLARFVKHNQDGDYLLFTNDGEHHVMSLRNGQLTDTSYWAGGDRRLYHIYEVR